MVNLESQLNRGREQAMGNWEVNRIGIGSKPWSIWEVNGIVVESRP